MCSIRTSPEVELPGDHSGALRRRPIRCAVYTRQSVKTSDDLSSCRIQRDVCRSYVESQCALGWVLISEPFDDEGYSGPPLARPALIASLLLLTVGWSIKS